MTTTYDPFHPAYLDDSDMRTEMNRVFDLCHGCRLCFKYCDAFPILFAAVDQHDDQDTERMTRAEQDSVVDACWNCKLCYVHCPYTPDMHEWELDFPRLMLRAEQVRKAEERQSLRTKITDHALGGADIIGTLNSGATAPVVNAALAKPGSKIRLAVERTVGIAQQRVLAPYNRTRFTTWFENRRPRLGRSRQAEVALFPTCIVEYSAASIGQDLVKVYERNGVACELPEGQVCCGAPYLHQGNLASFRKLAKKNIATLAASIRTADARGDELTVVVPQPTCSYVLKNDYPDYVGGADAELVAERTMDSSEFLWNRIHKGDDTELDQDFDGTVPESVTYHAPCHLQAQNIGLKSRDLIKRTGAKVKVVTECSAIDGTWGLREENYETARKYGAKLGAAIERHDAEIVAGDCALANGGITEETGSAPVHPMQLLARAYGIDEETP